MKTSELESFNIGRFSQKNGLSGNRVNALLDQKRGKNQGFKTLEESLEVFKTSVENSEKRYLSWYAWNDFSKKGLEAARNALEVELIYVNAPPKSEARNFALIKWIEFSLEEISKAITLNEVVFCYNQSPKDSRAKYSALKRWIDLSNQLFKHTSNFKESILAFRNIPHDTLTSHFAFKKLLKIASTKEEVELLIPFAPSFSLAQDFAIEKRIALAFDLEEIQTLYRQVPSQSLKLCAWEKWICLCEESCKLISNCKDAKKLFQFSPSTSEFRIKALHSWIVLAQSVDEIVEVFNESLIGSEIEMMALGKLIEAEH